MQWTNTRLPNGVDNLLKVQNSAGETYFFSGGEESVAKMFFFRLIIRKLSEFCRVDQIRWRPCL